MFGSTRCNTVEGQAHTSSCGGQVGCGEGTPRAAAAARDGASAYPQKSQLKKSKNNLSNELALCCPIQLMELSWTR